MTPPTALLALAFALTASTVRADQACWFENGVVVIPAQVMGVAGDYILDTASPHTQLAETQAQTAGFADTALTGEVRLAGLSLPNQAVTVADLDMRTGALPTPVAGVIGADVLRPYVLDIRFAPCRVSLTKAAGTRRARRQIALPLTWIAGQPTVRATVTDGAVALTAAFAVGTGVDTAIRLSDAVASAPGREKPRELYPYGVYRPRLGALSFAGDRMEEVAAGLIAAEDPELAGVIGGPLLARYRLRFDFPHDRLFVTNLPRAASGRH